MGSRPRYPGVCGWTVTLEEFHRAVDRPRWDTVPAPLNYEPARPPRPHRRRRDPSDGQAALHEEAS